MTEKKEHLQIMISPSMKEKLLQMKKNSYKIYGHEVSMSRILETLLINAADRETQIRERMKKMQRELCALGDELVVLEEKKKEAS
jgi:hypothetical protein